MTASIERDHLSSALIYRRSKSTLDFESGVEFTVVVS